MSSIHPVVGQRLGAYKTEVTEKSHARVDLLHGLQINIASSSLEDYTFELSELSDVARTTAAASLKWLGWEIEQKEDPKALLPLLTSLTREGERLQAVQASIESDMNQVVGEMDANTSDAHAQTEGAKVFQAHYLDYLNNHLAWLSNMKEQLELIKKMDPNQTASDLEGKIGELTKAIATLAEVIETTKGPSSIEAALDYVSAIPSAVDEALGAAANKVSEFIPVNLAKDVTALMAELFPEAANGQTAETLAPLLGKLKAGTSLEEAEIHVLLKGLEKSLNEKTLIITDKDLQKKLTDLLLGQIRKHPKFAKVIATTVALAVGGFVGGPAGAFAAKTAMDKAFDSFVPGSKPETEAERISSGVAEALGSFLIGGVKGAAISGGSTVFNEVAPQGAKDAATAASVAYVSNKAGLSLVSSLGMGAGAMVMLNNLKLLQTIKKDLQHAWKICKENPLKIIPGAFFFVRGEIKTTLSGLVKAVVDKNKTEGIVRASVLALTVLSCTFSLGSLPIVLALFYIVNRKYELKYEGPASAENASFRAYIKRELEGNFNESKLQQTLIEEGLEDLALELAFQLETKQAA